MRHSPFLTVDVKDEGGILSTRHPYLCPSHPMYIAHLNTNMTSTLRTQHRSHSYPGVRGTRMTQPCSTSGVSTASRDGLMIQTFGTCHRNGIASAVRPARETEAVSLLEALSGVGRKQFPIRTNRVLLATSCDHFTLEAHDQNASHYHIVLTYDAMR